MARVADVIVAGLGAMGAAVLHQLARSGVKAIGIDRWAPPHAFGSSHGETRITRLAVGEGAEYAPLVAASHRIWRELEERRGPLTSANELLNACGCLVISRPDGAAMHDSAGDFVETTIAAGAAAGVPVERLSAAELQHRFPQLQGIGDSHACFEPSGGFVHPERCIAAELDEARALGAQTVTARILAIRKNGAGVIVETDAGSFEAGECVAALGGWVAPMLGAPFDRLLKVTRQVLHWYEVEDAAAYLPGPFPTIIWMHGATSEDCFYGFPALPGTGRIKMATEQYHIATTAEGVQRRVAPEEGQSLYDIHLAPRLRGVKPGALASAVCHYTVAPGSRFIIDRHPAMERVTVVSPCSGHGFKHSAGLGEALAAQIASGRAHPALAPFALARLPQ